MATKWTKEQTDVIEFRDCNILVSAAAGSGKTAVLVERILSMLMDEKQPADIDRMLFVTFTNAAAGEMKERIRLAIDKKLEEELPPWLEEHLQKQIALLGNAQISTIHSFCQYVIRNYFHIIDLDPGFRISDEGENKLLIADVAEKLLEERYKEADPDFLMMTESLATGKDDNGLEDMMLRLYHYSQSFADPTGWLNEKKSDYTITDKEKFLELPWISLLVSQCLEYLRDIEESIRYALKLTQDADGPYMYEPMIQQDLEMISQIREQDDYISLGEALAYRVEGPALSRKKDGSVSDAKRETVKNLRGDYKKALKKLESDYFYASIEEVMKQMNRQSKVMEQLLDLTADFIDAFEQEKRRKNICDFNDLEHLALKILQNDQVAEELADHFEQIMIDEYQDSNMVQEILLKRVSRERRGIYNMFMVGDVKQSIYRFRLARPELFMEKYDTYSTTEGNCRRIDLHKNFRSRAHVLDSVNDIFEKIMLKNLGGVAYDEAARLNVGASFAEMEDESSFTSEIQILNLPKDAQEDEDEGAREAEARMIGHRIFSLLKEQKVWDKEEECYRPAQFKDIVILLRTMSRWSETFVKVLQDMGIPTFAGSRSGYFSAPEIQTILALLKIIDNPCQDIPLTAVLYSSIGKMDGKTLAGYRTGNKEKPFYQICMEAEECRGFFEMLEEFRNLAIYMPMHELLRYIYDKTGYYLYEASMPGGEQRAANLEMLIEKASAYEKGSYHGLYNFVRYIENLKKYEIDFGEADTLSGETNMVRLMSIHKSKGLEFPIVFVAGMGKTMNQMDARASLCMHAEYGIAADEVDPVLRIRRKTLIKNVLKNQIRNENLGEELRVLYVALTRAKEKLILTGTMKDAETALEKYLDRLNGQVMSFSDRTSATKYFDWVMPVALKMPEDGSLQIQVLSRKDLVEEEKERLEQAFMQKVFWESLSKDNTFDEDARKLLTQKLEYHYPYEQRIQVPSKVSVSELKAQSYHEVVQESYELFSEEEVQDLVPEFLKEEKVLSGAAKGTIYHKLMECMDFSKDPEDEIGRLTMNGIFTQSESSIIDTQQIRVFLESQLGQRMKKAQEKGELFREQQFVLEENAGEVKEEWSFDETILIQGIIDAFFKEDDGIVLVDYKTDRVNLQDASSLYEKYRIQLDYYERALERLTGQRVKEKVIYSFHLNRAISDNESNDGKKE